MENQIHTRDELIALIRSLAGQPNVLTVPRELSRFLGDDLPAALLLGQLIYWQGKQGRADGAIFKTYAEWYQETGLTEYQVRRATKKKLSEFVSTKIHRANGSPTVHYYLDIAKFSESFLKFLKERNLRNSRNQTLVSQDSLTRTTTKTTTKTTRTTAVVAEIAKLHEQNFGVITPLLGEKMKIFAEDYRGPIEWIKDAFSEAVSQNVRKWSYVGKILDTWQSEGRKPRGERKGTRNESHQRGNKAPSAERYRQSLER